MSSSPMRVTKICGTSRPPERAQHSLWRVQTWQLFTNLHPGRVLTVDPAWTLGQTKKQGIPGRCELCRMVGVRAAWCDWSQASRCMRVSWCGLDLIRQMCPRSLHMQLVVPQDLFVHLELID